MLQSGHGSRDRRTDGQTDGRTDRRTNGVKPIYPPTTSLFGGYNKFYAYICWQPGSRYSNEEHSWDVAIELLEQSFVIPLRSQYINAVFRCETMGVTELCETVLGSIRAYHPLMPEQNARQFAGVECKCKILRKNVFWFKHYWNLFPWIKLTMGQHWFRKWLGANRRQAITWTNDDPVHSVFQVKLKLGQGCYQSLEARRCHVIHGVRQVLLYRRRLGSLQVPAELDRADLISDAKL